MYTVRFFSGFMMQVICGFYWRWRFMEAKIYADNFVYFFSLSEEKSHRRYLKSWCKISNSVT